MKFLEMLLYIFFDPNNKYIEEFLNCKVSRSNWTNRYIEYQILGTLDDRRVKELEDTIKCHVQIIYKNFCYKVRVYNFILSPICDFEMVTSKKLVLGKGYDGLVKIPLNDETNNYLIVGASGSGKSSLAISILKNLKENGVELWVSDNKGSHDYDFLHLPMTKNVYDFMGMLSKFELEVEKRLSKDKKHKPLLFVIDEVFPIACLESKTKKELYNRLALVMSRCRSANCHIMIISQRSTTDIIDSRLMANISNRICLATASAQESINVLGDSTAFHISQIGRGILSINGRFTEFQSFYLPKPKFDKIQQEEPITIEDNEIVTKGVKINPKKLGGC